MLGITGMSYCIRDVEGEGGKEGEWVLEESLEEREMGGRGEVPRAEVEESNSVVFGEVELEEKPGVAPFVPGSIIPAKSAAVKAMGGEWSKKVAGVLRGMRKLAARAVPQGEVSKDTRSADIEIIEPEIKPGAPAPMVPTSAATRAVTGIWFENATGLLEGLRKLTQSSEPATRG